MSGRSSRQWHRRRQPIVFLAMVCVVVLVAAAQIEVAHFCQLATVTAGRHASARGSEATAPSICLICATAHQASMGTAHTPAAPSFAVIASAAPLAAQPQSRLHVFNLDVRPPPTPAL